MDAQADNIYMHTNAYDIRYSTVSSNEYTYNKTKKIKTNIIYIYIDCHIFLL